MKAQKITNVPTGVSLIGWSVYQTFPAILYKENDSTIIVQSGDKVARITECSTKYKPANVIKKALEVLK